MHARRGTVSAYTYTDVSITQMYLSSVHVVGVLRIHYQIEPFIFTRFSTTGLMQES